MSARKKRPRSTSHPESARAGPAQPSDARPWLLAGFSALAVLRPLIPGETADADAAELALVLASMLLAMVWAMIGIARRRWRGRFGATDAVVLVFFVLYAASALWAMVEAAPRPAINVMWRWVGLGMLFVLARQLLTTAREVRAIVALMISLAAGLSVYGLYQAAHEMPQTRAIYRSNPERALADLGLVLPAGSPERKLFEDRLNSVEPIATFTLTNSLAGFLAPWLIVAGAIGVASYGDARLARRTLVVLAIAGLPIVVCLMLTKSRSAYAAIAVGVLLMAVLRRRQGAVPRGWLVAGGAGVGLLAAVLTALGGLDRQIFTEAVKSLGYRLEYWQASLAMIGDHPWLGCGPGNFQDAYTQYKLPRASEVVADPHNFLIEIAATAGVPAMLAFLGVVASLVGAYLRAPRRNLEPASDAGETSTAVGLVGGGLAAGFLLAFPVSLMASAVTSPAAVLLGLPVAMLCFWGMRPWIEGGELPSSAIAAGVAVLLVNLLAAGGVGIPGVADTFWILAAAGLSLWEMERPRRNLRGLGGVLLVTVLVTLSYACVRSAYGPVLKRQSLTSQAAANPRRAEALLIEAAEADPLDAEPWRQLAALYFYRWQAAPTADLFVAFEEANRRALELRPRMSSLWRQAGRWYAIAHERGGRPQDAARAVEMVRRAVELYPHNAPLRAEWAELLQAAGDAEEARAQAERAQGLDALTPHVSHKLNDEQRKILERIISSSN